MSFVVLLRTETLSAWYRYYLKTLQFLKLDATDVLSGSLMQVRCFVSWGTSSAADSYASDGAAHAFKC